MLVYAVYAEMKLFIIQVRELYSAPTLAYSLPTKIGGQ